MLRRIFVSLLIFISCTQAAYAKSSTNFLPIVGNSFYFYPACEIKNVSGTLFLTLFSSNIQGFSMEAWETTGRYIGGYTQPGSYDLNTTSDSIVVYATADDLSYVACRYIQHTNPVCQYWKDPNGDLYQFTQNVVPHRVLVYRNGIYRYSIFFPDFRQVGSPNDLWQSYLDVHSSEKLLCDWNVAK